MGASLILFLNTLFEDNIFISIITRLLQNLSFKITIVSSIYKIRKVNINNICTEGQKLTEMPNFFFIFFSF